MEQSRHLAPQTFIRLYELEKKIKSGFKIKNVGITSYH